MAMVATRVTKRKEMMPIRLQEIEDSSTDVDIIHAESQPIKRMIVALIDQEMKPNLTLNKKKSKTEDHLGEIDVDLDTNVHVEMILKVMDKGQVTLRIAMPRTVTFHLVMSKMAKVSKMTSPVKMAPGIIDLGKIAEDTIVLEGGHHHRMEKKVRTATARREAREMALIMKNHATKTMKMRIKMRVNNVLVAGDHNNNGEEDTVDEDKMAVKVVENMVKNNLRILPLHGRMAHRRNAPLPRTFQVDNTTKYRTHAHMAPYFSLF